ncbi:MAG TPA: archaemetzincin family Zn-dependent metalloprotease [Bryobacteraceae bacterium]|nr:archaemetzincin family Zn-dependent metalloprotease [Bryobacteraceae bacterium]
MNWRLRTLHVLTVGDGVPLEIRDRAVAAASRILGFACRVSRQPFSCMEAYDPGRNQYHSTRILESLSRVEAEPDSRVLAVAAVDLYVPVLTFVFGEAQLHGRCALVSCHRLRDEFYGLPERPDLLEERLVKEAVHEIGHTFGLTHCDQWECVMASSHSVEKIDVKRAEFCSLCRAMIRAAA